MSCTYIKASMRITMGTAVWRIQSRRAGTKKHLPADVLLSSVWMEVVRFVTALLTSATSILNPETSALSLLDSSSPTAINFWLLVISSWKNCLVLESSATRSHLCILTFWSVKIAPMWWHCCRRPFRCLYGPYNFISTFDKWVLYVNKCAHNKERAWGPHWLLMSEGISWNMETLTCWGVAQLDVDDCGQICDCTADISNFDLEFWDLASELLVFFKFSSHHSLTSCKLILEHLLGSG